MGLGGGSSISGGRVFVGVVSAEATYAVRLFARVI